VLLCVCVALFKAELNLSTLVVHLAFYSSRPGSYTVTQGPTGGPKVVESLYSRALSARSSKLCLQQHGYVRSCHPATLYSVSSMSPCCRVTLHYSNVRRVVNRDDVAL
jgi:hypothetical protein